MGRNVVEGDGVWLVTSSAHDPDLVTPRKVKEVFIVPCVWHEEGVVVIGEWWEVHFGECFIAKGICKLNPAVDLVISGSVQGVPVVVECCFQVRDALGNCHFRISASK